MDRGIIATRERATPEQEESRQKGYHQIGRCLTRVEALAVAIDMERVPLDLKAAQLERLVAIARDLAPYALAQDVPQVEALGGRVERLLRNVHRRPEYQP